MRIRHVIAVADTDPMTGVVVAPERARHAVIVGGRLHDLSGPIDPATHLNLDEPAHLMTTCVVAERLTPGATVLRDDDGLFHAPVPPAAFRPARPGRPSRTPHRLARGECTPAAHARARRPMAEAAGLLGLLRLADSACRSAATRCRTGWRASPPPA